ncbi:MAG: hypothetical protein N3B16_09695 [Candidatus Aminicenantes bacterium]|nr:hypothetical protein [Candidatus Aminicenantes bacterium]
MKGLNEEIIHKGIRFHLQTQDLGPREPVIQAILYKAGRVLHTRRVSYAPYLNQPNQAEKVLSLLKELHSSIVADIRAGKFNHLLNPGEKQD